MRQLAYGLALWLAGPAAAQGDRAGDFAYYVLALSWSPSWCATAGGPEAAQCRSGRGFVLHGLWPQHETGWPADCATGAPDPGRAQTAAMADIMGSAGLAWHQWKKHGRCSGLSGAAYYRLARDAFGRIRVPERFRRPERDLTLPASGVEAAFTAANPGLTGAMLTVTCKAGLIAEVRICLAPDLSPRRCGPDIASDCRLPRALMAAPR